MYLALGVRFDDAKEILGIWIEQTEGAKFWLRVMTELKNRGVEDVLVAVVDGLKGFSQAINAASPQTQVQTCIVHLIRYNLDFVNWKDRNQWQEDIPFFTYPMEVRRIIYMTNAIESLTMQIRKVIKNRGHFPSDDAATKLIWLALRNIATNWKMPPITWRAAKTQFAILFAERFTAHL